MSSTDHPLPTLDFEFSPPAAGAAAGADSDSQLTQPDSAILRALQLDSPNDIPDADLIDASHPGDFSVPFASVDDDISMHSGVAPLSEDNAQDGFTLSQPPSVSSIADRQDSAPSITVQTTAAKYGRQAKQRRLSMAGSDDGDSPDSNRDGSQDSNHAGGNSLEDQMSDEFGLTSGGLGDGTDLGGSKAKADKADAIPAWSELKTKAGKERKRLPLACITCRRKKIRCSGEKPACKHCLRSRIPCVYKVTARKAAPRTDYMAMLDKRLKRMEERIIKIVPKADHDGAAPSVTRAVVKPAIPGTLSGAKSSAKKRGADEAFGADLDHWARAPAKSKLEADGKPSSLQVQEAEESKLLLEGGDALPSKELQEHLAEVFFENIYGQAYHLLHKPSYMRKLRAGTLPPVLILSVCAISARFSTHPKLSATPNFLRGEEWAAAARDIVMRRYDWPNITTLTCLLILGLHEFGTCHGGRSWALGGQAIRMAFALQLHKDLEYDPQRQSGKLQLSFIDREIRRRTMWACFLMDRFNSSGTDRPTFIREMTLKLPLPIKEKHFQLDIPGPTEYLDPSTAPPPGTDDAHFADAKENLGVAAWMVRAIAVWGRVITYLNQGGKELDPHPMWSPESEYGKLIKQTDDILSELPDSLAYTPENLHLHETENMANQFLFLHVAVQQNILFMNRFAVSSPNGAQQQDVPKAFVTKAGAKAFAAANRISEILKDAESHFVTAPFVGYCAFLSSTVHIFGIFSGNSALEAASKRNLATNVKFLSKMRRYWGMFHWMSENLREQYRTCADAARQGNPTSENSASPIFQYGDWFDRYPHGVSQTDFLDPASYKKKEKGDDAVLEQKPELHTVEEFFTTLSPRVPEAANAAAAAAAAASSTPSRPPAPVKRKSMVRKGSSATATRPDMQQLEPLQTDFSPEQAQQQLQQQHQQRLAHHRASFSRAAAAAAAQGEQGGPLGGQTSGPTSFNPLTIPNNPAATSYHALSPISPVTVSHYSHHGGHPRHAHHAAAQHGFFSPDPFAMSLAAHAGVNGMSALPQLDRQLVFGAYGHIDPGMGGMGAGWANDEHGANSRAAEAAARHNRRRGTGGGADGVPDAAAMQAAAFADPSSAWFMPFNMEPPEIGGDLGIGGVGLDGFAGMFNGSGIGTPNGMGGTGGTGRGGGMHH